MHMVGQVSRKNVRSHASRGSAAASVAAGRLDRLYESRLESVAQYTQAIQFVAEHVTYVVAAERLGNLAR